MRQNRTRLLLALSVLVLVLLCAACLTVEAQASPDPEPRPADSGRLPGDDIPATSACFIPADQVPVLCALPVTVTHYCTCARCCGKSDGITATGAEAVPHVTAAVDPDVIPLGTELVMDYGDGVLRTYRAEDTGGAIQSARVDICVGSHREALNLGVRSAVVYWEVAQ